ncbi:hypothetical protein COI53_28805, partial [Bacillus thuringiensis]|uniref:hypothetical protein n=1 Tax=Bacillus thuringiensis TaxID=1428 RepID=UPI000C0086E4
LTILGGILFAKFCVKRGIVLILVDWELLKDWFYENLVSGQVMTAILLWFQQLLQVLFQVLLQ